ncbi:hypothetical protein UREG_01977 [Uncinocarpus reesii 1704]|uniref:Translation initiation factor IF-2, mitochondrial n=1 Tax=Uncinocarpus reesii (strain UAMH 1704) TaxID=336963 RepID=C4JK20_UNCRE|nr:uncharacterized protein UREG_01977 [Uncinocarpus reesii 1704]EEP77128.1 hypothetical protein UREG_01977 [Uncinocarpus reesii 1704]
MRRSHVLKKALQSDCRQLRSQVRSAARIPNNRCFRQQARQFGSTISLRNGDNGDAAAASTSATSGPPKPKFGGGWAKPTFSSGPALTADEINLRDKLLTQRAQETLPADPKPIDASTTQEAQAAQDHSTPAVPNAERGPPGMRDGWGRPPFRSEPKPAGFVTQKPQAPQQSSPAKPNVKQQLPGTGDRLERPTFRPAQNPAGTTIQQPRIRFEGVLPRTSKTGSPPDNSVSRDRPSLNDGFISFRPGQKHTKAERNQLEKAFGSAQGPKSSSVAEREAKFRESRNDALRFTGFRKVTLDIPAAYSADETKLQFSNREEASTDNLESPFNPRTSKSSKSTPESDVEKTAYKNAANDVPYTHRKQRKEHRKKAIQHFDEPEDRFGLSRKSKYDLEDDDSRESRARRKQARKAEKDAKRKEYNAPTPIYLPEFISVSNLANALGVRPSAFLKSLHELGFEEATFDHILDAETAGLIAAEHNFEPIIETADNDLVAQPLPEDSSNLPPRPPVVTIMGHVDHGKTTLLDWLRKSSVAASEHGGITQHIGAFSVTMPSGKQITFLDTPGHSAFLEMRRRGADVTDIVILVVAADDSVKPQTIEAIKHANQAKVPIIVAINKIDKEDTSVQRVKQDLARHDVTVEDFGGDVQAVCVSGKTGQGMLELEEAAVTLSEMLDLRADQEGNAEGWVIEATTKRAGKAATVLVRRVAGTAWSRIRTLKNEAGVEVEEAPPGIAVEVDGWRHQPLAGSEVLQAPTEQIAKEVVALREGKEESKQLSSDIEAINELRQQRRQRALAAELAERYGEPVDEQADNATPSSNGIPFIVKADVSGSAEAIVNSMTAVGNNEVYAKVLRLYTAYLEKQKVGQIFEITIKGRKKTLIAGCKVRNGTITRSHKVRVIRGKDKTIVYEGSLTSLKNIKKDVTEMRKGTECGMGFEDWTDFRLGDQVQTYEVIYEKRYL